jgi:hypothetical protein
VIEERLALGEVGDAARVVQGLTERDLAPRFRSPREQLGDRVVEREEALVDSDSATPPL